MKKQAGKWAVNDAALVQFAGSDEIMRVIAVTDTGRAVAKTSCGSVKSEGKPGKWERVGRFELRTKTIGFWLPMQQSKWEFVAE